MSKVSKLKKLGIMLIVSGMLMSMLTACGGSKTAAADDTKDNNTTAQMRRIRPIRTKTMKRVTLPWTIR